MEQTKIKFSELQAKANEFISMMDELQGELNDESQELIKAVEQRIDTGFFVVDKLTSEIDDMKSMIKELKSRIEKKQKHLDFMTGVVIRSCEAIGIKKVESYKKFTICKKPARVEIVNKELINERFVKVQIKSVKSIDKTEIKEALKNGETVDGAVLIDDDKRIAIK